MHLLWRLWNNERLRPWFFLVLIALFGACLRFSDYTSLLRFNDDQVRDIKIVSRMAQGQAWPLLGPRAGGTLFQLGPMFYYLEYLSGTLFGFTPAGTTLLIPVLSTLSIGLCFILWRKLFPIHVSLVLTTLYALSFFTVKYARFGWNPNFVPFFLLAFFLLLSASLDPHTKRPYLISVLLGLVVGIGMQLHTFLLILMPLTFLAVHAYRVKKTQRWHWLHLGLTLLMLTGCFGTVLASEFQSGGTNTRAFFEGFFLKTTAHADDLNPVLVTADFSLQGISALLTGYEPRGQWVNPDAWQVAFSLNNTLLLSLSLTIVLGGIWCGIQKWRSPLDPATQFLFRLLLGFALLTLLCFLVIGNELNLRFFNLLFFLPLLMLGLMLEQLQQYLSTRWYVLIVSLGLLGLSVSNLIAYRQTFDFDHPRSLTKAYGGISYGEAEQLAQWIKEAITTEGRLPNIAPFDFETSVQYFLKTSDFNLKTIKETSLNPAGRFLILARDAKTSVFDPYEAHFQTQPIAPVGRFQLYWLEPR